MVGGSRAGRGKRVNQLCLMKSYYRLIASVLASGVFASALLGAGYLKIGDIKGESTDKDHKDWIVISSVQDLPTPSTREAGSGMATGKRQHKPVKFSKPVDKATPLLAKRAETDTKAKVASVASVLTFSQDGKTYVLSGAKVVSSTVKDGVETLLVSYESFEIVDKPTRAAPAQDHNSSRSNKTSS